MTTSIPIRNIYVLLCYAWDVQGLHGLLALNEDEAGPDSTNLLGFILAEGLERIVHRGIHREFFPVTKSMRGIRGKVRLSASLKRLELPRAICTCSFRELSEDTLPNRVLRASIGCLLESESTNPTLRKRLRRASKWLRGVTPIHLRGSEFRGIQIHAGHAPYRLMMGVCQLLYRCRITTEDPGGMRMRDFLRDEIVMRRIFERFVRNFVAREIPEYNLLPRSFAWQEVEGDPEDVGLLPTLEADLVLDRGDDVLLVDTKYTATSLSTHWRSDEPRLKREHLFQLFAYVRNFAQLDPTRPVAGMLLYPAIREANDITLRMHGSVVSIRYLDLRQPWASLSARIRSLMSG